MPVDYEELLRELETDEARLMTELNEIQAAKPLILRRKQAAERLSATSPLPLRGRFLGLGATKAIPMLLADKTVALTSREIMDELKAEGWTSNATDHLATVSATLSNLRDQWVIKVGEGWKIKPDNGYYKPRPSPDPQQAVMDELRDLSDAEIPDDVRELSMSVPTDW